MKKIKEIKEFAKMFKLNIPVEEHFEYYIQTLSHSFEFKDVIFLVKKYAEFEEWLEKNNYHNVGHYKMGSVYKMLVNHLESSEAYAKCLQFDYSSFKFYGKDHLGMYEGNFMLSLYFSSANFQSMKIFDEKNEMKANWNELCDSLGVHQMLASSKSFRQVIFGNLNPKRFQKIQHYHILKLVEKMKEIFPSEDFIFVSHDELVMNLGNDEKIAHERIKQILEVVEIIKNGCLTNGETWMNVKPTIFKMNKISKGIYVKTNFVSLENAIIQTYKTLFGCPGSMYYVNFKKHILEEPVEDRDCLFVIENKLAKWVL